MRTPYQIMKRKWPHGKERRNDTEVEKYVVRL